MPERHRTCPIRKANQWNNVWRVGGFGGDHDIEHLQVARNVGPRLPEAVSIVAETAFAENPIIDKSLRTESLERDVRPPARIILAEIGMAPTPWSEQAFAAMGSGDKLGTTAARIAVVTHHQGALEKTAALLEGILKDHPRDSMPDYVWMRFYELAFALAAAGSEAKPVIDPVIQMTCRTIAVWAPPFGLIVPRRSVQRGEKGWGGSVPNPSIANKCPPVIGEALLEEAPKTLCLLLETDPLRKDHSGCHAHRLCANTPL